MHAPAHVDEETTDPVARVIDGDIDAFEGIVLEHQSSIRAHLAVRLRDRHEADDLAQEVFLTAYSRISTFDRGRPLRAWLRGIADNLLRNHLRKKRAIAKGGADDVMVLLESRLAGMRENADDEEALEALRGCLGLLDERARRLVAMRYADEIPLAKICARTGRRHSAVTMSLHRLREKLRDCVRGKLAFARGAM